MDGDVTDADLARLIGSAGQSGRAAEAALYQRFGRRIELYGVRHLGSREHARDLVQQVLLSVLSALRAGRLHDPERLPSFVLGTCRNVSSEMRRKDRRQAEIAARGAPDAEALPPALSERDVLRLFGCIASLAEREASVVHMSFWEDRDADEIGGRLGVSAGNVRVIRHRAVVKLAACMNAGESA
jgi:RNA polymerase sigma-70 factor (ECF subfamily)